MVKFNFREIIIFVNDLFLKLFDYFLDCRVQKNSNCFAMPFSISGKWKQKGVTIIFISYQLYPLAIFLLVRGLSNFSLIKDGTVNR